MENKAENKSYVTVTFVGDDASIKGENVGMGDFLKALHLIGTVIKEDVPFVDGVNALARGYDDNDFKVVEKVMKEKED
ncbi:hypothetical protein phiCTP1_gp70 [Clostridium phage phiCTP1]|uniref:hypothetical protein n=1 Tax=Clostridium phage phiCTP1 TaxID=871584 RepID=UPI0001E07857|nr:hypothetical protein phiCTP1_gp70 [Clostridium phage phiCTP1]ADL40371.1 hypothetical phage protein [Clostridium phage phiCTP1]WMU08003.1 hypothetical protein vBCtySFA88_00071 [Clostridium phage vB_CtyS-FA88]